MALKFLNNKMILKGEHNLNCKTKTAFIAIVGVPNVGKSSILNKLLGQKISIVSAKPQTTRTRIMGVLTEKNTQLVFIDTPGIHKPKTELGRYMETSIKKSISSVDACMMVIDSKKELSNEEITLMKQLKDLELPVVLAINKIDLIKDKTVLMEKIKEYNDIFDFSAVVPVSAKTNDGLTDLKKELQNLALEGDFLFEEDELTDQPERVIVSEIIREKLLLLLDKEVPHGIAVSIEKMKERQNGDIIDIDGIIYCEKDTHKGIIIGKKGCMLKKIGSSARVDIENFLGLKVNLQLWVKVKEDWRNRVGLLKNFGFDKNDFS